MKDYLQYLFSLETKGIKLGLDRTQKLFQICKNPQKKISSIQVIGTNGKGSTSAMIANILKVSGYKVGLYTSPHLNRINERIRINGNKRAHPTQKPEALLYRILLASSNVGDLIFDPFLGSGTSAVVAKKLGRNFIGIEKNKEYFKLAKSRITKTRTLDKEIIKITRSRRDLPKIPFGELVGQGIIPPGAILSDAKNHYRAKVTVDGSIVTNKIRGSIHKVGAMVQGLQSCNGWDFWHLNNNKGKLLIDNIRNEYRSKNSLD